MDNVDVEEHQHLSMLLQNTNNLLKHVGISAKKISSVAELSRVASSMFVAVYESLFHVRLDGIIRSPQTKDEYAENAQRVIDGLSQQIHLNLQHITGKGIVGGDIRALSNLVHIFVRLVSVTTSGQSTPQFGHGEGHRALDENSQNGSNSISTHESLFDGGYEGRHHSSEKRSKFPNGSLFNQEDLQLIYDNDTLQFLKSSENRFKQEKKIEAARRRRENLRRSRERECHAANKRKAEISRSTIQKKWIDDRLRDEDSFKMRQSSEEHVLLRKIYRGLLAKMHEWRIDEHAEVRDRVNMIRDETKNHIKSLQTLFEDRVRLLKEQDQRNRKDEKEIVNSYKLMGIDLVQAYSGRQQRIMNEHRNILMQRRQQMLLQRREAHRDLLELLSAQNWHENLRQPETVKQTRKQK